MLAQFVKIKIPPARRFIQITNRHAQFLGDNLLQLHCEEVITALRILHVSKQPK